MRIDCTRELLTGPNGPTIRPHPLPDAECEAGEICVESDGTYFKLQGPDGGSIEVKTMVAYAGNLAEGGKVLSGELGIVKANYMEVASFLRANAELIYRSGAREMRALASMVDTKVPLRVGKGRKVEHVSSAACMSAQVRYAAGIDSGMIATSWWGTTPIRATPTGNT